MPQESSSKVPVIVGLALAGTGAAHFVRPQVFEDITKAAFTGDIRKHTLTNGGIETALGIGVAVPQTRKLAIAGIVAYGVYLGVNIARNR